MSINKFIIFLDFDGVVNTLYYRYYSKYHKKCFRICSSSESFVNNKQAIQLLNLLYKDFSFDIVITST